MQHFTDLENNEDSETEDMDQWDDVLRDGDETTPPQGSKDRLVPPLPKAPLGAALLNRIPMWVFQFLLSFSMLILYCRIGRKDYV